MSKISMSPREVKKLYELFNALHETEDYGTIILEQNKTDGEITATFYVTLKDIEGDFSVSLAEDDTNYMEWQETRGRDSE